MVFQSFVSVLFALNFLTIQAKINKSYCDEFELQRRNLYVLEFGLRFEIFISSIS